MAGLAPSNAVTASGFGPPPTPVSPLTTFGNPNSFTAAATQQASDYDTIMKEYQDLGNFYKNNPITSTNITPQVVQPTTTPYTQSSDVTNSLANLSNLTNTGGYSASDIADIRARDISPIRSIYAGAQQNVDQQRQLQGGYSPNYDAVQAQMARDEANQIASTTTAVNAGIAQNVAANKIATAAPYASSAASANATQLEANQANANIINQINEANAGSNLAAQQANQQAALTAAFGNRQGLTGSIQGQTSLYGTTPALTNTFGNQVVNASNIAAQQQNLQQQQQKNLLAGVGMNRNA